MISTHHLNIDGAGQLRISANQDCPLIRGTNLLVPRTLSAHLSLLKKDSSNLQVIEDYYVFRNDMTIRLLESACRHQVANITGGHPLLPLTMTELAVISGSDASTVSRIARIASIRIGSTDTFLDQLFCLGIPDSGGNEGITVDRVKDSMRVIYARNGDRLSDQDVCSLLASEFGIQIARRTVAKYRHSTDVKTRSLQFKIPGLVNSEIDGLNVPSGFWAVIAQQGISTYDDFLNTSLNNLNNLYTHLTGSHRQFLIDMALNRNLRGTNQMGNAIGTPNSAQDGLSTAVRKQLRTQGSPFIVDRVGAPFEQVMDLEEINERAYSTIVREIQQVSSTPDHQSRGVLILGEAGTGKTHLLARVYQRLSHKNHMLFVSNPSNPEGVFSFTWFEINRSLRQNLPNSTVSQGEYLLRLAFSQIILNSIKEGTEWSGRNIDAWKLRAQRIREMESIGEDLDSVRNRITQYWMSRFDGDDIHKKFINGLFNLIAYRDQNKRALVAEWLTSFEAESEELKELGLPTWAGVDESTIGLDYTAKRENWALKGIRVISKLAAIAGKPLVLAFDQLEAMHGNPELTRRWGQAVKQIMDEANNLVVVTCIFPSLWKGWFRMADASGLCPLDDASTDRIIGGGAIELEPLQLNIAKRIIDSRIKSLGIPELSANPRLIFTEKSVVEIFDSLTTRKSIRSILKVCHDRYQTLVHGTQLTRENETANSILLRHLFEQSHLPDIAEPDDHAIKRLEELFKTLFCSPTFEKNKSVYIGSQKTWRKRVLPYHIVINILNPEGVESELVFGICNQVGTSLGAKLRNWKALRDSDPKSHYIFLRSWRAKEPGVATQAHALIAELRNAGNFHQIKSAEEEMFYGIYRTYQAILEKNIECNQNAITVEDFAVFFQDVMRDRVATVLGISSNFIPKTTPSPAYVTVRNGNEHVPESLPAPVAPSFNPATYEFDPGEIAASKEIAKPDFSVSSDEINELTEKLKTFIGEYRIPVSIRGLAIEENVVAAPHIIAFHLSAENGADYKIVERNQTNASIYLKRHVRIYPNIARGKITFELGRLERKKWTLSQALSGMRVANEHEGGVIVPIGCDSNGDLVTANLFDPPHLLIGGAAGSGKSNFLSCLVGSIICRYSSDYVKISILDPKRIDFSAFKRAGVPHLRTLAVETQEILAALGVLRSMMMQRFNQLEAANCSKWSELQSRGIARSPYEIIVIDEAALLADEKEKFFEPVCQIANLGRAAGICMVIATQYPLATVLPSKMTVNMNNRIAFKLANSSQSNVVIDESGAESLIGKGDCLAKVAMGDVKRILTPEFDGEFVDALTRSTLRKVA